MEVLSSNPSNLQLCESCEPVGTWIQSGLKTGQWDDIAPSNTFESQLSLGTLSEMRNHLDCTLCRFITTSLGESFDPPLALEYPDYHDPTHKWNESITIDTLYLVGKQGRFQKTVFDVGFRITFASFGAQADTAQDDDEDVTTPGYKFYPTFRLLAEDAGLVPMGSRQSIRLARQIQPNQCDIRGICDIYSFCTNTHGNVCETPRDMHVDLTGKHRPPIPPMIDGLRLVDVKNKCVVSGQHGFRYVALSYVWGERPFLRLLQENVTQLEYPGSLAGREVPRTLSEAMSLTEMLGERYLWIDALCIVQDDEISKVKQINQMDQIYLSATLTIVAGDGADAYAGLTGFLPGSRTFNQNTTNIAGLRFVSLTAPLVKTLDNVKWNTRAWTFQEYMLSKRLLIFTEQQAYFICRLHAYSEDSVMMNIQPSTMTDEDIQEVRIWKHPQWAVDPRLQIGGAREISKSNSWHIFQRLVQQISERGITNHADILRSVTGVLATVGRFKHEDYICGMPISMLETALMWQPLGSLRRRAACYSGRPFPSWSWAGWEGKIRYEKNHSPFHFSPFVRNWMLYVPSRDSPRSSAKLEYSLEEISQAMKYQLVRPLQGDYDYHPTLWSGQKFAEAKSAPKPKSTLTSLFQKISKSNKPSSESVPPLAIPTEPVLSIESAVLNFTTQTSTFLIDPTPTATFHAGLKTPFTAVYRILNQERQWAGTIHLACDNPFLLHNALVPAEFAAISLSHNSFEDTNTVNPGPNVGQNTFDTNLWRQMNLPLREVMLVNVLWILEGWCCI